MEIRRATTTLRRGRYADGFEVGVVSLNEQASRNERWRFEQGLEIMLAHSWNPGIVPIRDVAATRNAYAVVCANGTLAEFATLDSPLHHRLRVIRQVALTLSSLHASGHVHGCLSAHNVFLIRDLDAVLDEVAMVNLHESLGGDPDGSHGYGSYAAPEATRPGEATPTMDVYSLGRLMELLITREQPTPGASSSLVAHKLAGQAPQMMLDIVLRCLSNDPRQRYPSVGAVLEAASL